MISSLVEWKKWVVEKQEKAKQATEDARNAYLIYEHQQTLIVPDPIPLQGRKRKSRKRKHIKTR